MPPNEKNRTQNGMGVSGSEEPHIVDLYRGLSGEEERKTGAYPGYSIISVWLGILILAGMLGFGFYQTRVWVEGVRKGLEQVSQENKLLLEGLDELLARADGSDQVAYLEPSRADKPVQGEENANKSLSDNLSRRYKIYYRTKEGESLAEVSEKFGVSEDQLRLWNTIKPKDSLIPGQVLVINKRTSPEDQATTVRVSTPPDADSLVAKRKEAAPVETEPEPAEVPSNTQNETAPTQAEQALEGTGIDEVGLAKGTVEPVVPENEEEIPETAETAGGEPLEESPLAPDEEIIHTVQAGETLSEIGQVYGIPWQILAEYNHIDRPETLYEGQKLLVPGDAAQQRTANRVDELTHTVLAGENLYRIGLKYGISWEQIARENNMRDGGLLYEGQVLKIPAARGGPEF
jgi:LysM repeat protein